MFKKKPSIKTLSPLRSSDRRKITDQIIAEYHLEVPTNDPVDGDVNETATNAATGGVGALRNSLLPDGSLSAKFSTTAGPELKTVVGTVYVGSHPGEEQRILWFRLDERIYPTVYTLWKHPRIVPLLHTPDIVLCKMHGGADLMTPGLARGPPFPPRASKGATVAVASLEKPSVPSVVGICEIDVNALSRVQGVKGHAVRSLHWDGDEIWAWSQGGKVGGPAPDGIEGWETDIEDTGAGESSDGLPKEIEDMRLSQSDDKQPADKTEDADSTAITRHNRNSFVDGEDAIPFEEVGKQRKEFTTKEVDNVFHRAFCFSMHQSRHANPENIRHGIDFPVPQSLFISNYILPFLPIFDKEDEDSLQLKKTSWKAAKKFIKSLEKEHLLKSKDRNGGETVIQEVNFEDPAIMTFIPYALPKRGATGADSGGGDSGKPITSGTSAHDDTIGQTLKKITLLKPKEKLAPIFAAANSNLKTLYLPAEVRPIITAYIESENLVSEANKRLVNLNPVLANTVFDGQSSMDREVLAKGSVPRDALIDRILQSCAPYWAILRNDEARESAKPKAGSAPTVKILLETRSGNKTVTKVSGVEAFFINPQSLADELQKACASSTSVNQLVGSSPKVPIMEILIQGPQKDIVTKALEKRGVHRTWIEVMDKTKGKKR